MKAIFYSASGDMIDMVNVIDSADASRVVLVKDYPDYAPKEGMTGKLVVRDGIVQWEYTPIPPAPPAEPTEDEKLRADVDYIAAMTGVELV